MSRRRAFTLIELSVAIVIISILMAIAAKSANLLPAARLANARSITSKSVVPTIPGLVAWYESSSIDSFKTNEAVNNGQISEWRDISPNSIASQQNKLTRTASSAVTYVTSGIGKLPSVAFNGSGKLSLASFYQGNSAQNTIFIVAKPYAIGPGIVATDSAVTPSTKVTLNSAGIYADWGQSAQISDSSCCTTNTDYIIAFYANGSSSKGYINNASTMAGGSTINPGAGTLNGLTVGSSYDNTSSFNGLISEVIVYSRPLKDYERKEVMRYLNKKYGIAVANI